MLDFQFLLVFNYYQAWYTYKDASFVPVHRHVISHCLCCVQGVMVKDDC